MDVIFHNNMFVSLNSSFSTRAVGVRLANSKAGIKPTAPLSAFDKENSIEFPLDSLHYLYNYYIDILNGTLEVCLLFSSKLGCSDSMRGLVFGVLSVK